MTSSDDDWLESLGTVPVQEEICHWQECTALALYRAVMSNPCVHRWAFCMGHKDNMDQRQSYAANIGDISGGWTCPIGGNHKIGIVVAWESARG